MIELAVGATPIELRVRDVRVRAWLSALHATASHVVRGDIHNGHLRLYSVPDGKALALTIWSAIRVTVRVPGAPGFNDFDTAQSALSFLDDMVEHHVAGQAEAAQPGRA